MHFVFEFVITGDLPIGIHSACVVGVSEKKFSFTSTRNYKFVTALNFVISIICVGASQTFV